MIRYALQKEFKKGVGTGSDGWRTPRRKAPAY